MSLFKKISVVLLILAFFGSAFFGIFIYIVNKKQSEQAVGREQLKVNFATLNTLDRWLAERQNDIQFFSRFQEIRAHLESPEDILLAQIVHDEIEELTHLDGSWHSVAVVDVAGKVTVSSGKLENTVITDKYEVEYKLFKSALQGKVSFSDQFSSGLIEKNTLLFAAPVRSDQDKKIVGIIFGYVDWNVIVEMLNLSSIESQLFNKQGLEIARSEDVHYGGKPERGHNELVQKALQGESGFEEHISLDDGIEMFGVYAQEAGYFDYGGNGWVLLFDQPRSRIAAEVRRSALIVVTLFILGALFFSATALFIFNKIVLRPIGLLTNLTRKVAGGDFKQKINLFTNDELGLLATSFNTMTSKLSESYTDLDKKIQEKTSELSNQISELSDSKKAFVNLLDDARELEGELKLEKERVEQKVLERTKELSTEHSRTMSLVESIKLGIIMVDLNYNVITANSAAKIILGQPIDKRLAFSEVDEKLKSINLSHALTYYVGESKLVNVKEVAIGEKFYHLFMSAVRDKTEKIFIGAVIILEDITEQKIVDRMRTEIISVTSHQLRTPLSVIKGNLEMVLSGDAGKVLKEQKEIIGEALAGNSRMIKLVNDLTDVSKITEGKLGLTFKPAKLEDLLRQITEELALIVKKNKITLDLKIADSLSEVFIDEQRIKQVLQNLIDNALKYAPAGGNGKVSVYLEKSGTDNLQLMVKDNGVGIPVNEQGKIFERFFRASNVIKMDPGSGTGLGLFIAKSIIAQHKGKLWFESQENKGTTFYLSLPVIQNSKKEVDRFN